LWNIDFPCYDFTNAMQPLIRIIVGTNLTPSIEAPTSLFALKLIPNRASMLCHITTTITVSSAQTSNKF